jgi:hypothetical protein
LRYLIEEIRYKFTMLLRWIREQKLRLFGINRSFYCQRKFEEESKCVYQCDHCKEYYKPIEKK